MLLQPNLETNRLVLRPLSVTDAASIQIAASDRAISDTMLSIPHPYPDREAARYVAKQQVEFELGKTVTFAIEHNVEKIFLGLIEIREIEQDHSQAELSFWLASKHWGQGYMSEALAPVVQFGFEELELNRLYAYHMVRNPGSGKVLQANGFVHEGILRQRVRKWGVFEDVALWAILRTDWQSVRS